MLLERLLKPSYRFRIWELEFDSKKFVEGLRRKGIHVAELREDWDVELTVEAFLGSTFGEHVYLIKFKDGIKLLARTTDPLKKEFKLKENAYLVRNEGALKKLILSQTSTMMKILMGFQPLVIWAPLVFGLQYLDERYPFAGFFLVLLGFFLNDLLKTLEYFILGYCRE
ncbi:hypothetical protein E3E35_07630 [Thermococcus sp. GR7]|uniref:hypothetical protein n=1 Tax=unclassified Thermococcus TaxID=2627626 RepID=UPI001431850F|nr:MULTISPECIES: hypothetical protein [unclassified Thermococcus]NJE47270.1 hypothetical protein [Thermococcus sp. GR7]NJE78635.1 hypothetical protein [Thermococcus sp. GR4]NJF23240.1 hypothetical protein [Thermococcus sp. GR5]